MVSSASVHALYYEARIPERLFSCQGLLGLAGQPVHEFAHSACRPFEAVAVDDQEGADDEDREADLRHDTSIQWLLP